MTNPKDPLDMNDQQNYPQPVASLSRKVSSTEYRREQHDHLARTVAEITNVLMRAYAMGGPFVVRASAEYTAGAKEVYTPAAGRVEIETVFGSCKCFEVREK